MRAFIEREEQTMTHRTNFAVAVVVALATAGPAIAVDVDRASDVDRVVWKGAYTAPYHVAAECLAGKMSGDFGEAAVIQDRTGAVRVGFWQDEMRHGQPVAYFHIQAAGDDRVEIGWRRAPDLPDAARLDEAARAAAVECGGRSA